MTSLDLTLDPAGRDGWVEFRSLAHRMVEDMCSHLESLRNQPAWQEMPADIRKSFVEPVPRMGVGADAAYREFLDRILRYTNGNLHPRFWGWVQGNGTPLGMMADMLAAGINPHMGGFNQAPALVEQQVLAWLTELLGLPINTSGVLVGGGTMANVLGLTVARQSAAERIGLDIRKEGVYGLGRRWIVYASDQTHNWIRKAVELMGLGADSIHRVRVDGEYRIDVRELAQAIIADKANGLEPFCVVGTAGTVMTGATDGLVALADLCQGEKIWFHIDGAFGALAKLSRNHAAIVDGLERADSVAFDLHKWCYLPFECACVLVRDAELHRRTFASSASYIDAERRGVIAGGLPFADRGIDLTRSFKALKVWLSLKAYGVASIADIIDQNIAQAQFLANLISTADDLELLAPAPLNVVCFRYSPEGVSESERNEINREILLRVQESGVAVPSGIMLGERFAIRVANVNHRSQYADFTELVEAVRTIGSAVRKETHSSPAHGS